MRISQLASAVGVSVETVRFYQRSGLLDVPPRTAGYRDYGANALDRLRFIRRAQGLGFTLEEISALLQLSVSNCEDVERIAHERLEAVTQKIDDLHRVAGVLRGVVARCAAREPYEGCPIIETLVTS